MAQETGFSDAGASKGKEGCSARLRKFGRSICNTEKGEFLGRNASSWAKIGVFYIIFYSCLAGFFAAMLVGFFATLDEKVPTQQRMYSLIKGNPGMAFRPMVNVESTLIKIDPVDNQLVSDMISNINDTMREYQKPQNGTPVDCSGGSRTNPKDVCIPSLNFGPCVEENLWGYKNSTPCVLLKMNRVFDWTPRAFSNETETDEEVKKRHEQAQVALGNRFSSDHVGVSCEGETDADKDHIGDVEYYPREGFPFAFYPYLNQDGYRSPLVFARFTGLPKGRLIQVYCKLWAANIKHHKNDRAGSVHFEMMIVE